METETEDPFDIATRILERWHREGYRWIVKPPGGKEVAWVPTRNFPFMKMSSAHQLINPLDRELASYIATSIRHGAKYDLP